MNAIVGDTLASWNGFSRSQKIIAAGMYATTVSRPLISSYVAYRGRDPQRDWTTSDTVLTTIADITDFIDGAVTRATGTTTKLGSATDQLSDRLTTAVQEVPLVFRGEESVGRMGARLGRDASITLLRASVDKKTNGERSTSSSWPGKGNTAFRMATGAFAISPLGNKYPQVREGLQRASTATTILSGLYNAVTLLKR